MKSNEGLIRYFERQMRDLLGQHQREADEPWAGLAGREPSDDELLQVLSISTTSDQWPQAGFAYTTPFEAIATLSESDRAHICDEFRRLLKPAGRYH
jgi:hypothetical protein